MGSVGFVQGRTLPVARGTFVPTTCPGTPALKHAAVRTARAPAHVAMANGHGKASTGATDHSPLGFVAEPDKYSESSSAANSTTHGLREAPEVAMGMAVAFFAALRDFLDHLTRLGTGLENLTEAEIQRVLRRSLNKIETLKAAQKVELKAREDLEQRLELAEQAKSDSLTTLQEAREEAEITSRSLASALEGTKAELAFAEKAIAQLRSKKSSNTAANAGEESLGTKLEKEKLELEMNTSLRKLQDKLETSARELGKESALRKKQQKRVGELEILMKDSEVTIGQLASRSELLEKELHASAEKLSEITRAPAETDHLEAEKRDLQMRVQTLEKSLGEKDQRINELIGAQDKLDKQIRASQDSITQAKSALDAETRKAKDLSKQLAIVKEENNSATGIVSDLASQLEDRTSQLQGAEDENVILKGKLAESEKALIKAKADKAKGKAMATTKKDLDRAVAKADELRQTVGTLENAIEEKSALLASTQKELLEKTSEQGTTNEELSMAKTELKAYEMEFSSREEILHGMWDSNHKLNEDLDKIKGENDTLREKVTSLEKKELSREKDILTKNEKQSKAESRRKKEKLALATELKDQKEQNDVLEASFKELNDKAKKLDNERKSFEKQLAELQAKTSKEITATSERKLKDLREQMKDMEALITEREDELESAESEISELRRKLMKHDASGRNLRDSVDATLVADEGRSKIALAEVKENLTAQKVVLNAEILRAQAHAQTSLSEGGDDVEAQSEMKLAAIKSEAAAEQGMMEAGIQKARASAKVAEVKADQKEQLVKDVMTTVQGETSKRQKRRKRRQ